MTDTGISVDGVPKTLVLQARAAATRALFGAPLQPQGRGYYVMLELLAIVWGVMKDMDGDGNPQKILDPQADELTYLRRPRDFARRLISDPSASFFPDSHPNFGQLPEPQVLEAVSSLLAGLTVPVPFLTKNDWYKTHFFPYEGDLVHYDAVIRKGKPKLERDAYRGGGLLVYDLLRLDKDVGRRMQIAQEIEKLVEESHAPVGRTVRMLEKFDQLEAKNLTQYFECHYQECRETQFAELLRSGTHEILSLDVGRTRKVQYLMQWVPFIVALHQRELAYREHSPADDPEAKPTPPILLAVEENVMLRSVSRFELGETQRVITGALDRTVSRLVDDGTIDKKVAKVMRQDTSSKWQEEPAQFFAFTMAAVGALNANKGLRHFVFRPSLLETVVAATVGGGSVPFQEFTDDLLDSKLGFVVSRKSCATAQLRQAVDGGRAERNERELERLMLDCGLLDQLSDSSSIVRLSAEGAP